MASVPVGVVVDTVGSRIRNINAERAGVIGIKGCDGLLVEAMPVALWRAYDKQVNFVCFGGEKAQCAKIGPRGCPRLIGQAVADFARETESESGFAVHQTR